MSQNQVTNLFTAGVRLCEHRNPNGIPSLHDFEPCEMFISVQSKLSIDSFFTSMKLWRLELSFPLTNLPGKPNLSHPVKECLQEKQPSSVTETWTCGSFNHPARIQSPKRFLKENDHLFNNSSIQGCFCA